MLSFCLWRNSHEMESANGIVILCLKIGMSSCVTEWHLKLWYVIRFIIF